MKMKIQKMMRRTMRTEMMNNKNKKKKRLPKDHNQWVKAQAKMQSFNLNQLSQKFQSHKVLSNHQKKNKNDLNTKI